MKKTFYFITVFFLVLTTQISYANKSDQLQIKIDELIKKNSPNANIAVIVKSLNNNNTLYQKNPNQLFIPASTLKLISTISALSFLGPNYNFETKILAKNSNIKEGTLKGDLYLYFDGDPSLTSEDIENLVKELSLSVIKKITGNLYVDDSIFDHEVLGPGWMWEDLNFCYASPITATIIDKNCIPITLTAANKQNKLATLTNTKDHISITSSVITKKSSPKQKICPLKLKATNNNSYTLSGCLKKDSKPLKLSIALRNIDLYVKNLLLAKLQKNNIELTGSIKFKQIPKNQKSQLQVLAKHQSKPLRELIKPLLKESDNTIADSVYKKLGYTFFNEKASWKNSGKAIQEILETQTGFSFKEMNIEDGSGLSHHNLITPDLIMKTLIYAYNNPNIKQAFIDALPYAGTDGTLEKRMLNLKDRVYAKTGNMKGTSSLAGFIETKSKDKVAFVIMFNSFLGKSKDIHKLQNEICTIIADS